jgi:HK97 family phage major capsid protein
MKAVIDGQEYSFSQATKAEWAVRQSEDFSLSDHSHLDIPLLRGNALLQMRAALSGWAGDRGGYLISEGFGDSVELGLSLYSVVRQLARVIRRDKLADMGLPTCDDTSTEGTMLAEGGTLTDSDLSFELTRFKPSKFFSGRLAFPSELIEDAIGVRGNLEQSVWLGDRLSRRVARRQNRAFTVGIYPGPIGVVNGAAVGVTAASATQIAGDELFGLIEAHNAAYQDVPTCGFMMNQATFLKVRKLKDAQGQYLFPQVGRQRTIANFPVFINPHMPDYTTGTGGRPILFGDFSRYVIFDLGNAEIRTYREDPGFADQDKTAVELTLRSDGGLLDPGTHPVVALQLP